MLSFCDDRRTMMKIKSLHDVKDELVLLVACGHNPIAIVWSCVGYFVWTLGNSVLLKWSSNQCGSAPSWAEVARSQQHLQYQQLHLRPKGLAKIMQNRSWLANQNKIDHFGWKSSISMPLEANAYIPPNTAKKKLYWCQLHFVVYLAASILVDVFMFQITSWGHKG